LGVLWAEWFSTDCACVGWLVAAEFAGHLACFSFWLLFGGGFYLTLHVAVVAELLRGEKKL
jgi:hypothetical protein